MSTRLTNWLLLLLLLGQLALLSAQVPDASGHGTQLELWALRLTAPVARTATGALAVAGGVWRGVSTRRSLRTENERLLAENRALRRQLLQTYDLGQELDRLSEAVRYQDALNIPLLAADIVYADYTSWLRTLVLRVPGERLQRDQPVVASEGVVGRVWRVAGPYAKVQLVTDRAASVGAMLVRSRRQGVVHGAEGGDLVLEFVPRQTEIEPGEAVVTSGIDGVFPRGLPIGTVRLVAPGSSLFHYVEVVPAVDFGRLDQVYVLDSAPLPEELREASVDAGS